MSLGSPPAPGLEALDHAAADGAPAPVPVTVLTGFLGAGKTTLHPEHGGPGRPGADRPDRHVAGRTDERYRLIEAVRCDVPLSVLLPAGRFDSARSIQAGGDQAGGDQAGHRPQVTGALATWTYKTDRPLSLEALRAAASRLPADVYRAKGIVHTADVAGRPVILQVVKPVVRTSAHRPLYSPDQSWKGGTRRWKWPW